MGYSVAGNNHEFNEPNTRWYQFFVLELNRYSKFPNISQTIQPCEEAKESQCAGKLRNPNGLGAFDCV